MSGNLLPLAEAFGRISPDQQRRMDEATARVRDRRAQAAHVAIVERRAPVAQRVAERGFANGEYYERLEPTGEVNCARCQHIGGFSAEQQRGFCLWLRHMVSTWHPCVCKAFRED